MHVLSFVMGLMAGYLSIVNIIHLNLIEKISGKNIAPKFQYFTLLITVCICIFFISGILPQILQMVHSLIYLNFTLFYIALVTVAHIVGIMGGTLGGLYTHCKMIGN